MDPKFQSSFIPKGSVAATAAFSAGGVPKKPQAHGVFGFLAVIIFIIAVCLTGGVVGYKIYLNSSISKMGTDLEAARQSLQPDVITDLARLNSRISATQNLVAQHVVLSPVFDFLESATVQSVRFTSFNYSAANLDGNTGTQSGPTLLMKGSARGYSSVSLQSDAFNGSKAVTNPVFSDLSLDDKGSVDFSVTMGVDPSILSYTTELKNNAPFFQPATSTSATTTATTTAAVKTATTTASSKTTTH